MKDSGVFLYTHWGSGSIVEDVRAALASPAGRGRWNDEEYLARIIFDVMTDGQHGEETGFGIGTQSHGDLDFPPIVVDCGNKVVSASRTYEQPDGFSLSFKEFTDEGS
jgi:hypothetical protein